MNCSLLSHLNVYRNRHHQIAEFLIEHDAKHNEKSGICHSNSYLCKLYTCSHTHTTHTLAHTHTHCMQINVQSARRNLLFIEDKYVHDMDIILYLLHIHYRTSFL